MNDTSTHDHPKRWRLLLVAFIASLALLAGACGDDDDAGDAAPADIGETTDDDMADDDMADDDMADDDMADDGLDEIRAELAAAGLDDAQITCVVDAAVAEWGADALTEAGQVSDDQLLRLGEITFGCA